MIPLMTNGDTNNVSHGGFHNSKSKRCQYRYWYQLSILYSIWTTNGSDLRGNGAGHHSI